MVEEIITALSRIRWLFVIARTPSFTYKGQALDVTRVGRELGMRYVLEGSVRRAGQRVRISLPHGFEYRIAEIGSGRTKASGRIDLDLTDTYAQFANIHLSDSGVVEEAAA